jgi:hypothetical protein
MSHSLNLKRLLILAGLIGLQLPVIAQSESWTSHQYFDQRTKAWWVQVSSTVPRVLQVTVTWHGSRGVGRPVKGWFVLLVPAYPGFGAAVTAQKGVPGLKQFAYSAVSN